MNIFKSVFIFLLSINLQLFSQNVDSLKSLLGNKFVNKADIYNQLADIYKDKNIDSSKIFIKKAIVESGKNNDNELLAKAYYINGHIVKREGNFNEALKYYIKCLELYIDIEDSTGQSKAYNNIGDIYFYNNDFKSALKNYKLACILKEKTRDDKGLAITYSKIGNVYMQQANYDEALANYQHALKIFEDVEFIYGSASIYNNIGIIYENMKQYKKALENYNKALAIIDTANYPLESAEYLNNIGNIYLNTNDYNKALVFYKKSLYYNKKTGNKQGIASCFNNIGIVFRYMGKIAEAIEYYNNAIQINKEIKNKHEYALNLIALGKCYSELKKYSKAENCYYKSYKIAKNNADMRLLSIYYDAMNDHFYKMGNYKNAYNYKDSLMIIKDSLLNIETFEKISELQTKYETEKKEKEIEILSKEKQVKELQLTRNKYLLIALIAVIILIVMLFILVFRQSRLKSLQKNIKLQQKLLRTQMNPHFIFNSLIAIQSFIFKNNSLEAGKYLSGFARLMRLILENSREENVLLQREIDTLKYYMDLQKLRFNKSFDYKLDIDPMLNPEIISVPPMLAQPFIENAIEHGMKNKDVQGLIIVSFIKKDCNIIFEIKDNGVGIKKAGKKSSDHKSLATEITHDRLMIINRNQKNKIYLKIEDLSEINEETGTRVTFTIPYKTI